MKLQESRHKRQGSWDLQYEVTAEEAAAGTAGRACVSPFLPVHTDSCYSFLFLPSAVFLKKISIFLKIHISLMTFGLSTFQI